MNGMERIALALRHKEADRVPFSFGAGMACRFTRGFYARLLQYLGLPDDGGESVGPPLTLAIASDAVLERLGVDAREAKPRFVNNESGIAEEWEDTESFYKRDEWGTVYRMPKKNGLCYDLYEFPLGGDCGEEEDGRFAWPSPPKVDPESRKTAKTYRTAGYPVMACEGFANGFLQTGTHIYGYEKWMMILAQEKPRARRFNERLLERKALWWENILDAYGGAIDVVCENDDLGTQTGPFVSREMFRDLVLPYHRRLFEHIKKKADVKVFFHSCGSVSPFYRDLIEAGVDVINPVQISAANMDPYYLKREFGKDLVFWGGGVDTQYVLPRGTKDEIEDSVKRNMEAFGKGGGFVFAPVHNVQADVPVENFLHLIESYQKYCNY